MFPAPFRVVLDANVLFPLTVRDTLLRAAALGMYQVHWSEEILDEARGAVYAELRVTSSEGPTGNRASARQVSEWWR
jgi:hypothetical protein